MKKIPGGTGRTPVDGRRAYVHCCELPGIFGPTFLDSNIFRQRQSLPFVGGYPFWGFDVKEDLAVVFHI